MHIHIATIGKTYQVVIDGLKSIPGIEKVYLIHSEEYLESAQTVANYLDNIHTPVELIQVDRYDFQGVTDHIARIKETEDAEGQNKYTINITGGTKLMAFAALSSAYFIGATVYYVSDDEKKPLEEKLLTIATTRAPKTGKADRKEREILRFIFEESSNGTISNSSIEKRFGMSKQQVSYYVKNLRADGLITTESGRCDPETGSTNYRFNTIKLTQQGMMEARFTRNN